MTNALLLLGAGIAFGSTATFGMHFVRPSASSARANVRSPVSFILDRSVTKLSRSGYRHRGKAKGYLCPTAPGIQYSPSSLPVSL